MPPTRPRWGSLQYWPRKRAGKALPRVNWKPITQFTQDSKESGLLGAIVYKVGMRSAVVKDDTPNAMTKGKKMVVPATILEVPPMGVYAVRFLKHGVSVKDVIVSTDKDLKRVVRLPKAAKNLDSEIPQDYDDITLLVYSKVSKIGIKKTPDISEIALKSADKLAFAKQLAARELTIKDVLVSSLYDTRGLTKGKGLVGPVKRMGISLKAHKSEKGVRRPGSLAPWHPAHVTFKTPHAGQMGMFTRIQRNMKLITINNATAMPQITPSSGFIHYGVVKGDFVILQGSVPGPQKRQLLLTPSSRPTKKLARRKYEFVEVI